MILWWRWSWWWWWYGSYSSSLQNFQTITSSSHKVSEQKCREAVCYVCVWEWGRRNKREGISSWNGKGLINLLGKAIHHAKCQVSSDLYFLCPLCFSVCAYVTVSGYIYIKWSDCERQRKKDCVCEPPGAIASVAVCSSFYKLLLTSLLAIHYHFHYWILSLLLWSQK